MASFDVKGVYSKLVKSGVKFRVQICQYKREGSLFDQLSEIQCLGKWLYCKATYYSIVIVTSVGK